MKKKSLRDLKLSFSALSFGKHHFEYEMIDSFWEAYPEADIKGGSVSIELDLIKNERLIELNFSFKGVVKTFCDRCLKELDLKIDKEEKIIVKFSTRDDEEIEGDDCLWIIGEKQNEIELQSYFYEVVCTQRPIQLLCGLDQNQVSLCDQSMLDYIASSIDQDPERLANNEDIQGDNPWEILKKLK